MNNLFLNINKFKIMKLKSYNFQYSVSDSNTELVSQFKNLSIIFDFKFNFFSYIEMIKNKGFCNLEFIKRTCGLFLDSIPLKILNCSLVRSNLKYYPSFG